MKRLLFVLALSVAASSPAWAADILPPPVALPPHAPAAYVPVVPLYNWSGFYIGGNLGAAWNSGGSVSDTFGSTFSGSGQAIKFVGVAKLA
jgi:outer membrane immunogenic protein